MERVIKWNYTFIQGKINLPSKKYEKLFKSFDAWGGPASMGTDEYMPEEPTWPGTYIIHSAQPYRTPTWPLSKIKWGIQLQDKPRKNDVWYKLPSGKWGSVKNDTGVSRLDIIRLYYKLYGQMRVPKKWVFNDFGPIAIRWFKDINNNKNLDKNEKLSGQMFHTTPTNEAENNLGKTINLVPSHGCIHLKPADRDSIFSLGGFKPKTTFIVHSYHEKF